MDNVDGWGEASLLDIANYKNGLAMQKFRPKAGDPGLPVLKIRELGQGCCGPDSERCQSDIDEAVAVHDGDLVFSWSGTLLLDFWAGGDAGLNQHLFKVTSAAYPSWFYYMWTKYHLRKFIAMAKDRATTMGHIKRSALADSKVLIPERPILEELTESMQPIVDQVILNKVENRKLGSLRDVLLPKLMSGEIDVSKVDLTQLNSHLDAPSHRLPGHLTDPLIRVPRRKTSHPRRDLMCRNFSSFPRLGREPPLNDMSKGLPHFSSTEKSVGKGGEAMEGSQRPAVLLVV